MVHDVWVSTAPRDIGLFTDGLRISHDPDDGPRILDVARRNEKGEVFTAEAFPKRVVYTKPGRAMKKVPNCFVAGNFAGITGRALPAFQQGDLGQGSLFPVEGYQHDQKTPLPGEGLYLFNYGNIKAGSFLPEQSGGVREDPFRKGIWTLEGTAKDGDIAVSAHVLDGPDIWVDDRVEGALFLSGRIVAGLKKAGVFKAFKLKACVVVDE